MSTSSLHDSAVQSPTATSIEYSVTGSVPSLRESQIVETRQYRAALALNNVGVALLERKSYRNALLTFRKASHWIRSLSGVNETCNTTEKDEKRSRSEIATDIERDLTEANTLLRLCQVNGKEQKMAQCQDMQLFAYTIIMDTSYDEIFEAATSYPIRNHGYVILIDTSGDDGYTSNIVLQTSVILLNYAVAYQCLVNRQGRKTRNIDREEKYLKLGHKLFSLAHELLEEEEKRLQCKLDCSESNDSVWYFSDCMDQIKLVRLVAVQALMHLSFDLNKTDEGHQYYLLLGDLHLGYDKPQEEFKRSRVFAPAA